MMIREQMILKKNDKNLQLNEEHKYTKNNNNSNSNLFSLTKTLSNRIKTIDLVNKMKAKSKNQRRNVYNSNFQKEDNNTFFQPNNFQNKNTSIHQLKIDNLKNTLTPPKNIYKSAAEIELKYELIIMEKDKIINKLKEEIEYYKKLLESSTNTTNTNINSIQILNSNLNKEIFNTPQKNNYTNVKLQTIEHNSELMNQGNETLIKPENIFSERLNKYYTPKANNMLKKFIYNNQSNSTKNSTLHRKYPSNSITSTYNESGSVISNHNKVLSSPSFTDNNKNNVCLLIEPHDLFKDNLNYKNQLNNITFKVTKLIDSLFKYVK